MECCWLGVVKPKPSFRYESLPHSLVGLVPSAPLRAGKATSGSGVFTGGSPGLDRDERCGSTECQCSSRSSAGPRVSRNPDGIGRSITGR